jgi:YggT family protein
VEYVIFLINIASQLISILIIAQVLLSYVMSPYHPLRQTIDRLLEPLYTPIRRFLPQTGGLDFSPVILIIVVQIVARLLTGILNTL